MIVIIIAIPPAKPNHQSVVNQSAKLVSANVRHAAFQCNKALRKPYLLTFISLSKALLNLTAEGLGSTISSILTFRYYKIERYKWRDS